MGNSYILRQMNESTNEPTTHDLRPSVAPKNHIRNHISDHISTSSTDKANSRWPRDDVRYWQKAVFKPVASRNGKRTESPCYAAQFYLKGKRMVLSLGTGNKAAAAHKARDIFKSIDKRGWDATLADPTSPAYRPQKKVAGPKCDATVGDYLKIVQEAFYPARDNKERSFEQYAQSVRHVAADIAKINDRSKLGHYLWRQAVEAVKLDVFTDSSIKKWHADYLDDVYSDSAKHERAGSRAAAMAHACSSLVTTLRMCRVLFRDEIVDEIREKFVLPDPVPFTSKAISKLGREVRKKAASTKYTRPLGDISELISAARSQLDQETYKTFVLAIFCGLRRSEIDGLYWSAFRWDERVLRIETTDDLKLKTRGSAADIPLDDFVATLFREYYDNASGEKFVIRGRGLSRPDSKHYLLRCARVFLDLNDWLRNYTIASGDDKGKKPLAHAAKPLHSLRKEFGSLILERDGIYAASQALRHTKTAITETFYVATRTKSMPGIGQLLAPPPANIVAMEGAA